MIALNQFHNNNKCRITVSAHWFDKVKKLIRYPMT